MNLNKPSCISFHYFCDSGIHLGDKLTYKSTSKYHHGHLQIMFCSDIFSSGNVTDIN